MADVSHLPSVRLKKTVRIAHPWIFARSLEKPESRIPPGSVVNLLQPDGSFAARGFYNGHGRIGFRVMTLNPIEQVDGNFLRKRIAVAIEWRRAQGLFDQHNVVRLIHGEGDQLSGLIVDLYDDIIAIQWVAAGMFRMRELIREILLEFFPGARFYWFAEKRIQKQESFDCWDMTPPEPVIVHEHGLKFRVEVGSMHKTGFFADQRENRLFLAQLSREKRVLDLCCHSGGFAIYAKALGHASEVRGVDLDENAIQIAKSNANLNNADVSFETKDVYDWLRLAIERGEKYDIVILDPAKQTRSQEGLEGALAQYVAMNRLAMQVVAPSGILLTCSCSGLISEESFLDCIRRAAHHAQKHAQIFRISGASSDHPFLAQVPEARYLKAVWARIIESDSLMH